VPTFDLAEQDLQVPQPPSYPPDLDAGSLVVASLDPQPELADLHGKPAVQDLVLVGRSLW
jgi:hypothetical protein